MFKITMKKKYQLATLFACMFMVAVAGNPQFDRSRLQRAVKTHAVKVDRPSTGLDNSSSVQLLRQSLHKPPLDSIDLVKIAGTKIVTSQAYFLEWDNDGNLYLTDSVSCPIGWAVTMESDSAVMRASKFYGNFGLKFYPQDDGKLMIRYGEWNEYSSIGLGRTRIDTIAYACAVPLEWLWDQDTPAEGNEGVVMEDGSVMFEEPFVMFIEQVCKEYYNSRLISSDTTTLLSPVYCDLTILTPNGTNRYMQVLDVQHTKVAEMSDFTFPVLPNGVGGIVPRPVDPRPIKPRVDNPFEAQFIKAKKRYFDLAKLDFDVEFRPIGTMCGPDGVGGIVPRPVDPRPIKPGTRFLDVTRVDPKPVRNICAGKTMSPYMGEPVYIFQPDDSTVMVYNLMGQGYVMNKMILHADNTVTYPLQVMGYNSEQGAYTYNCTLADDNDSTLTVGCQGTVSSTVIDLGDVAVYAPVDGANTEIYSNFKLTLNDGYQFVLPSPYLLGDANGDKIVNISDVTFLIDYLLSNEPVGLIRENAADVNRDGIINISDVTSLIDHLLGANQ